MSSYGRLVDEALEAGFNQTLNINGATVTVDKHINNCGCCTVTPMPPTHDPRGYSLEEEEAEGFLGGGSANGRPTKAEKRKAMPVTTGVLNYFPDAIKYVSTVSKAGNDQHHPDKPLHWDKTKSTDELDALVRHLIDHGVNPLDDDGILHLGKVAWRSLAALQRYIETNDTAI